MGSYADEGWLQEGCRHCYHQHISCSRRLDAAGESSITTHTLVWFEFGTYEASRGKVVHGDLTRYFERDPEARIIMAGWYFVMMFGLPAACFAM